MIIKFLYQFSIDKQAVVGKELQERDDHGEQEGNSDSNQLESSDSSVLKDLSEISSKELPEASEKNRFMLNPLSENLKGKLLPYCMCESKISILLAC